MAVSYATSLKTTRMDAVKAAIDAGSAGGTLEICSAAYAAVLAAVPLADPCGVVSGAELTFTMPRSVAAAVSGTAAIARIKDSDGNIVVSGLTVGLSAVDIVLDILSITAGQTVGLSSATITHG
jgi:hypothetical protein